MSAVPSFLPSLSAKNAGRSSRKAEWDGKKSWTSDSVAVAVRGRWQRKQALSPAMKEREEGRKEEGWVGLLARSLALSLRRAIYQQGKTSPKHSNMLSHCSRSRRHRRTEKRIGHFLRKSFKTDLRWQIMKMGYDGFSKFYLSSINAVIVRVQ